MIKISQDIINFINNQGFVIVCSVDKGGTTNCACKDIVRISPEGRIYLLDLYRGKTRWNLRSNPRISITAVDEDKFIGYCLKGNATIIDEGTLEPEILKAWEERISSRLAKRLIKNIKEEKGKAFHPEALLPGPQYLIIVDVDEIVDLAPHQLNLGK